MKLININFLIILWWSVSGVYAQQEAQYTQYMYNMNIINPAYAGSIDGTLSLGLMGRSQWVNVPGAPQTATFSAHKPLKNGLGVGISLLADKLGPVNEQFLYADVSYTIPVGYYSNIAFGVKAGTTLFSAALADLKTFDIATDDSFSENISSIKPNFGAGVFYYSDKHYIGLSVPNILHSAYLDKEGNAVTKVNKINHFFLTGGYVFDINEDWKFKPSSMLKINLGTPLSMDISANALYKERLEAGLSYRLSESVSGLVNFRITEDLRIGYAYDYTLTDIKKFTSGTHEIFILFNINNKVIILSPRFF